MKASVMRMILMKLTAGSSEVCAPAPCSGQTFYRRFERPVNARAFRVRTRAACRFALKYAKMAAQVPPSRGGQSAAGPASSKQTLVL